MVVVHYYAGASARESIELLSRQAEELGIGIDAVVIDHGGTSEDRQELGSIRACQVVTPAENGGFAKGVNRGFAAIEGDPVLVANPDVRLAPGGLAALLARIRAGAGVVGPSFYWDPEKRFILPPTEERDLLSETMRALSERSAAWARKARHRWRRHALRHWRAVDGLDSWALSGALLVISRQAWQRVGPFDERFRLYFEETDWLRRSRRAGIQAIYVPRAIAVHDVGGSTRREPRAQAWFEDSAARFRRKHYGVVGARFLERLAKTNRAWRPELAIRTLAADIETATWLEVSPNRTGFPAAGEPIADRQRDTGDWDPGPRLLRAVERGDQCLWLRAVDDRGWESLPHRLTNSLHGGAT